MTTWVRKILIATTVIAAPIVAHAYGGWDYADPQGQVWVVFRMTCKAVVFYIALPYGIFALLQTFVLRKSGLKALIVWVLYFGWLGSRTKLLSVMGELGPAHLAFSITGYALLAAVGLSLLRTAVAIGPAQTSLKRNWQRLSISLEIVALIIILALPSLMSESRMAANGRQKCLEMDMRATASWVHLYQNDFHAYPSSIRSLFVDEFGDEPPEQGRVCPVTAEEYVYQLNKREDVITIQCPAHGSRQFNISDVSFRLPGA